MTHIEYIKDLYENQGLSLREIAKQSKRQIQKRLCERGRKGYTLKEQAKQVPYYTESEVTGHCLERETIKALANGRKI